MTALEKPSWSEIAPPAWTLMKVNERLHWEKLTSEFQDYNYRQGWAYEIASAERHNAQVEHVAIKVGTEVLGLATVRLKSIPLLKTGIAYVGGGPLTRRGSEDDIAALEICLAALREEYLQHRGYTLRILPPLQPHGGDDAVIDCYRIANFGDSPWPPPYRTIVVDINRPLPDIRKTLAQKWRNCLNNSEKQNLSIRSGSEPELFKEFDNLFNQFTDRKHISVDQGADFYCDVRSRCQGDDGYYVALALQNDVPIAGYLVSMLGDTAVLLLACTGEQGLKCKAANFLQWYTITVAKERGMKWYDLGGIDPENLPGVYHFKSGVGGRETSSPGPFQVAPHGVLGSVTPAMEKLYRWTKRQTRK